MDWFLYDSDLRHERVKEDQVVNLIAESVSLCWSYKIKLQTSKVTPNPKVTPNLGISTNTSLKV